MGTIGDAGSPPPRFDVRRRATASDRGIHATRPRRAVT